MVTPSYPSKIEGHTVLEHLRERCLGERDVVSWNRVCVEWANADCVDKIRKVWSIEESPYEEGYLRCSREDNLKQEVILAARTPGGADQSGPAPRWVGLVYIQILPSNATRVDNLLADISGKVTIVHTCPEWRAGSGAVSGSSATGRFYCDTGVEGILLSP